MSAGRKILVTGSNGLLGDALRALAPSTPHEFIFVSRAEGDLEQADSARELIERSRPACIVNAAAVVGGIRYNMEAPEELLSRNRAINKNLLGAALALRVPKVISFLSSCIFPHDAPEPWD